MFSKLVALCALVAVSQAGLLPEPHYSSAVSSQSIVRHDESQGHKLIAASPVHYAASAPIHYATPAQVHYATPAHQSSAVSSQSIVRHDESQGHKLVAAPLAYHAAPAPVAYHSAPVYHAAPAPVAYHAAPVATYQAHHEEIAHPKYEYSYSVADGHTGDNKSQQESRDGDVVKGSYSLHEADGSIRTVEYTADDHHGFNAVVHNSAPAQHVIKAAPLLVKAAPALQYYHR